jgi:hypothetical protein
MLRIKLLFFGTILCSSIHAQINRSANEFARENIRNYIETNIFPGSAYKPVTQGELIPRKTGGEVVWYLVQNFVVTKKNGLQESGRFIFYLDKKMNVRRAERVFAVTSAG